MFRASWRKVCPGPGVNQMGKTQQCGIETRLPGHQEHHREGPEATCTLIVELMANSDPGDSF